MGNLTSMLPASMSIYPLRDYDPLHGLPGKVNNPRTGSRIKFTPNVPEQSRINAKTTIFTHPTYIGAYGERKNNALFTPKFRHMDPQFMVYQTVQPQQHWLGWKTVYPDGPAKTDLFTHLQRRPQQR